MTVEYAPGYWRKRKRQRQEARRQRRTRPPAERAPVEYDLPTGKTLHARRAAAAEECSAERSKIAPGDNGVEPAEDDRETYTPR